MQEVKIDIPDTDLPGKARNRAYCSACGERVMDGREEISGDKVLCRACSGSKYYRKSEK